MNMVKRSLGVISVLATIFAPVGPALAQHGTHSIAQTPTPAKVNETGAALRDLSVTRPSLEDVYLELTAEAPDEARHD